VIWFLLYQLNTKSSSLLNCLSNYERDCDFINGFRVISLSLATSVLLSWNGGCTLALAPGRDAVAWPLSHSVPVGTGGAASATLHLSATQAREVGEKLANQGSCCLSLEVLGLSDGLAKVLHELVVAATVEVATARVAEIVSPAGGIHFVDGISATVVGSTPVAVDWNRSAVQEWCSTPAGTASQHSEDTVESIL